MRNSYRLSYAMTAKIALITAGRWNRPRAVAALAHVLIHHVTGATQRYGVDQLIQDFL